MTSTDVVLPSQGSPGICNTTNATPTHNRRLNFDGSPATPSPHTQKGYFNAEDQGVFHPLQQPQGLQSQMFPPPRTFEHGPSNMYGGITNNPEPPPPPAAY